MENKLTPDERKLKWKQEKKERREQLVKRYQNAGIYAYRDFICSSRLL